MRHTLAVLLFLLLAGCATPEAEQGTPPTVEPTPAAPAAPHEATVRLHNDPTPGVPPKTMGIDPPRLELPANTPIALLVSNVGRGTHNLIIDGIAETANIDPGAEETLTLAAIPAGTYRMWCSIGGDGPLGHAGQGMEGEVIVS